MKLDKDLSAIWASAELSSNLGREQTFALLVLTQEVRNFLKAVENEK